MEDLKADFPDLSTETLNNAITQSLHEMLNKSVKTLMKFMKNIEKLNV